MANITIQNLPQDVLVALARSASQNDGTIEEEARRALIRLFSDARLGPQRTWARAQVDQYRYSKMPALKRSAIEILRGHRLERDRLIGDAFETVVLDI
jgi:plasmid stability protein